MELRVVGVGARSGLRVKWLVVGRVLLRLQRGLVGLVLRLLLLLLLLLWGWLLSRDTLAMVRVVVLVYPARGDRKSVV